MLACVLEMFCSLDIQLTTAKQEETMLVHTRVHDSEKLCHCLNGRHFAFHYPDYFSYLDTNKNSVTGAVWIIKVPLYSAKI